MLLTFIVINLEVQRNFPISVEKNYWCIYHDASYIDFQFNYGAGANLTVKLVYDRTAYMTIINHCDVPLWSLDHKT